MSPRASSRSASTGRSPASSATPASTAGCCSRSCSATAPSPPGCASAGSTRRPSGACSADKPGFRLSSRAVRIERVDVYGYGLRYAHGEYVMSGGRTIASLPSTVVRIETEDGIAGHGETCPLGATYLPASAAGARAALGELAPALLGVDAT